MSDERDNEKQAVANVFSRAASIYDRVGPRSFAYFGQRLVELAGISRGSQVLDVAAGRGAILFPSAEQVGLEGHVIAIDLAEAMVKETSEEIQRRGIRNAEIRQMDAEQLEFPDASFDYVLSGFALFYFPHVEDALAEFRRVLKPRGQLVVSTWSKRDERSSWYEDLLRLYQPERKSNPSKARSPIFSTADGMESLMSDSGYSDIRVIPGEGVFVYSNEEEWWGTLWSHGGRRPLEKMPPDVLERFKTDVIEKLQMHNQQSNGVHQILRALFTISIKPSD